ncbi:MAG TPA: helix-turn-helix transcriptional regulator [Candidatus Polarisedimenticolia bacterium]|nr:helix-turn-helix transcriptional regulator [Candidatus Polarisedimenticolia bacterium]
MAPGHPFYQRLNELLEVAHSDEFVEGQCSKFYAAKYGRPSLTPGIYFRALLIGCFEGIDSERGNLFSIVEIMSRRDYLGEFEHMVILALLRLADRAYGVTVRQEIEVRTHREVSIGAIYVTLDRLEAKGYVPSRLGEPHPRARRPFETLLSCYS